jgi:hypothetical protein
MPFRLAAATFAVTLLLTAAGAAQTLQQDSANAPALELSATQKQAVFQSVSKTQKNHAAPTGFRVSIGATVPPGVELEPVSDTLATLIPQARGYEAGMIEAQVIVVDPKRKVVVAVVTGE